MNARSAEPFVWMAALVILSALIAREAFARAELERAVPLTARELYAAIGASQVKLQLVDIRAELEDYDDTHVPGSIPLPGCEPAGAPAGVAERVLASVPTVIISAAGERAAFDACAARFTAARNLAGGMSAWSDANLPEDSGDYVPPKAAAGGGCL